MISDLSVVGPILLGAAAVMLLVISAYWVRSSRAKRSPENNSKKKSQSPTKKDRELLDLIGDLAELYRATGR